jgi:hypothetical protein
LTRWLRETDPDGTRICRRNGGAAVADAGDTMVSGDKRNEHHTRRDPASDGAGEPTNGDEAGAAPETRGLEGFARRAIESGVFRMQQTEEGLRSIASAVVPRELINKTLDGVDTAKSEAVAVVGRELRTFLSNLNVGEELSKILTSVSFEVRMQVRFVPNEDGTLRASVKSDGGPRVHVDGERKRARHDAADAAAEHVAAASDGAVDAATAAEAATAAATAAEGRAGANAARREAELQASDARRDASRARRTMVKGVAMRIAERTAAAARGAAEVAAEAAAEVVNRSLDPDYLADRDDDDHELDSY